MRERDLASGGEEVRRMQDGVQGWVRRAARRGEAGLRGVPPTVVLSVLGAAAVCPVLAASAGITGVALASVLSSFGSGVLSNVISNALDRLPGYGGSSGPAQENLEGELAKQIQDTLEAGGKRSAALRAEIGTLLRRIDAGGVALRTAMEAGNERIRMDVLAAVGELGSGFAELEFLIKDTASAAAAIQKALDEQSAHDRVVIEQNYQQSTELRLIRRELALIEARTRETVVGSAAAEKDRPRWTLGCPYRGLRCFEENDEAVFCGRERLSSALTARLAQVKLGGGIVVVTGASGAGKSSLLRAGLVPALARGELSGSAYWPRVIITPTEDPLTELAMHLAALAGADPEALRERLARRPDTAHQVVRQVLLGHAAGEQGGPPPDGDAPGRLVLIVDQFEQVFTLRPHVKADAERQAFIAALHAAATEPAKPGGQPPALVVLSVRGDCLDRCTTSSELAHALQDNHFVVGPMTEPELRRAIIGPASAAGLRLEDGLADTILSDLRAVGGSVTVGILPLLSQAMLLTWENRENNQLTRRGYGKAGGVELAVQTSADAAYEAVTSHQRQLARRLLCTMTMAGRDGQFTRRPVSRSELYAREPHVDKAQIDSILELFASKRLIVLNDGIAEMSHDALLDYWPTLRTWLEDDRTRWTLHSQLTEDASTWRDANGDPSFLYQGTRLAVVQKAITEWSADPGRYPPLTGPEREFLHASERVATRRLRQRRAVTIALAILLVVALAGATAGLLGANSAIREAKVADHQRVLAVSGQLAAQSEALDSVDPVAAASLAVAAWRIAPTPPAHASLLDVLAQPGRGTLAVDRTALTGVAFSPNGKLLATVGSDGTARIWSTAAHRPIGRSLTANRRRLTAVAFSPNGKLLATAGNDGTARLWDMNTHRQIGRPMSADPRALTALAFSPSGTMLATASNDGTARIWDIGTHRQIGSALMANGRHLTAVAFSPSGKLLATAGSDGTARIWSTSTHRQIGRPMSADTRTLTAVAFSPNGTMLATTSNDGTARLWRTRTHRQIGTPMRADSSFLGALAFKADGTTLATASNDGTARLWNVATQQQIGSALAAGGGPVRSVAFSPNGRILATGGNNGTARLWDVAIDRPEGTPLTAGKNLLAGKSTFMTGVVFSPNGKLVATTGSDGAARLWSTTTHRQVGAALPASDGPLTALALSPDGKVLGTAGDDGMARLWSVTTHQPIGVVPTYKGHATVLAFSPNSSVLATGSWDGTARLWNVATHQQIGRPLATHGNFVSSVAFSPDGKILATASQAGVIKLWSVATHREIGTPMSADGSFVASVTFSPSGKILASASWDGTARLWDVATHQQIGTPLTADTSFVNAVAFSPDGKTLATASWDGTARLWDVATHQQIGAPLTTDSGSVTAVAFSPDGKSLATASQDGTARLWYIGLPDNILRAACVIAGRSLTPREWDAIIQSQPFQPTCPGKS